MGDFEDVRSKLSKGGSASSLNGASNETLLAELNALKKKYDAVVEYTVHLTAERDTILAQLEEMQKAYNREKQPKKDGLTKAVSSNSSFVESKVSLIPNGI